MAVYKLIQDIEAEDKLLGPLTLKAFIYALIAAFLIFVNFQVVKMGALGFIRIPILLVLLVPTALFAVLASPLGRDQPTEVWLLSHIRFFLKPRTRVWNKSGVKETVTVTVPKKVEQHLTKEFSSTEAKSRLKALANTLDSRGWAVKNVAVSDVSLASYLDNEDSNTERLVPVQSILKSEPVADIQASDDILDENHNPKAKKVEKLLASNEKERRAEVSESLTKLADKPVAKKALFSPAPTAAPKVTAPRQTDKLKGLAQSGNALSVASVEQLANTGQIKQISPNEVEIALH